MVFLVFLCEIIWPAAPSERKSGRGGAGVSLLTISAMTVQSFPLFTTGPGDAALAPCPPLVGYLFSFPSSSVPLSSFFSCSVAVSPSHSIPLVLLLTLAFGFSVFAFETILSLRQLRCYRKTEADERLKDVIKGVEAKRAKEAKGKEEDLYNQFDSKFTKAQLYGFDKLSFGIVQSTYAVLEASLLTLSGYLPYMWSLSFALYSFLSSRLPPRFVPAADSGLEEISVSVVFFLATSLVTEVTSLPWELYGKFRVEEKHGFNKMTLGLFFGDKVKSLLLLFALGSPILALVLVFLKYTGPHFYVYTWALTFCLCLLANTVYPEYIMPLFNKFVPLPEGPLRAKIFALAKAQSFPLTKLFEMDGSKRTSHSNAFLFGFGKNKRIVIYDTLLKQVSDDEIVAVLGHELGHWAKWHTFTNFVVVQVYMAVLFTSFAAATTSNVVPAAFGFTSPTVPTFISLTLFLTALWPAVEKVVSFLLTLNSRRAEFEADRYSVDLGMGAALGRALANIHLENLGTMCPDWAYSTYTYSHPPLVERLQAIDDWDEKRDKKKM